MTAGRAPRKPARPPLGRAMAVLMACVAVGGAGLTAPAGAAPSRALSALTCDCHEAAPPGSVARHDEIARGLRSGLGRA
ncbi:MULTISPECIES: hypothetical protein [unclassified Mycobacterium]|uniref:hypothetical protein n=1 Tax=unclassified Mycobacterium TaxID=2642494 RepID=UPI000A7ACAF7|nr:MULTISPECIES: hypothetical protein [unclassified Mycobacterium]